MQAKLRPVCHGRLRNLTVCQHMITRTMCYSFQMVQKIPYSGFITFRIRPAPNLMLPKQPIHLIADVCEFGTGKLLQFCTVKNIFIGLRHRRTKKTARKA